MSLIAGFRGFFGRVVFLGQRGLTPWWIFALWGVYLLLLGRSLIDSWAFPWYGNPDQDLVFLRDGLRIWRGQPPGYGDHPGLVQMLVVWTALALLSIAAKFGCPWGFDAQAPVDADWQVLFVAAKVVNVLLMSLLLVFCAALLSRWVGGVSAGLWGLMCGVSMALVAEIYQLRNEFFSSFLVLAGLLVALNGVAFWREMSGLVRAKGFWGLILSVAASAGAFALCFLAVLAKVQVLPVLLAFFLFVFSLAFAFGWYRFLGLFACFLAVLSFALVLVLAHFYGGFSGLSWQSVVVVVALSAPSSLLATAYWLSSPGPRAYRLISLAGWLAGCMMVSTIFLGFSRRAEWLGLLVEPGSVRAYAEHAGGCLDNGWLCHLQGGLKGVAYLFERSVDSYALAPAVGMIVLCGVCLSFALFLRRSMSLKTSSVRELEEWLKILAGGFCVVVAVGMAFLAGQRWAVDHYLPYQQPFLFLGILLLSRKAAPLWWLWRSILVVIAISVVLIFLRYPEGAPDTYTKEDIRVVPEVGRGDGSLCADQHAGAEWKSSSLWVLCDGFDR